MTPEKTIEASESDAPKPHVDALLSAAAVAKALRTEDLEPYDIEFDELGGLALWYAWPKDTEATGEAQRWAWIAGMNSGDITCVLRSKEKGREAECITDLNHVDCEILVVGRFLRTGKAG
jgi:hypothetical protein